MTIETQEQLLERFAQGQTGGIGSDDLRAFIKSAALKSELKSTKPQSMYIGYIGTSLVQQGTEGIAGSLNVVSDTTRCWQKWADVLSHGRLHCPSWIDTTVYSGWGDRDFNGYNFGVSGQTSTEILNRVSDIPDEAWARMSLVFVDAGTNDTNTETAQFIQQNREGICEYCLSKGVAVVLLPILSRATTVWSSDSTARKTANMVNNLSRAYVKRNKDILFFDWNESWSNKNSINTVPYDTYSSDGTHFDPSGAFYVGKALAEFMDSFLAKPQYRVYSQDDIYDASINTKGNLIVNPFCLGDSGTTSAGCTGTVADGLKVSRTTGSDITCVASKEVRLDNRGEWQVLTFTVNSNTTIHEFEFETSSNISHTIAGEWVIASCEVEVNDTDGLYQICPFLRDAGPITDGINSNRAYGLREFQMELDGASGRSTIIPAVTGGWKGLIVCQPIKLDELSTWIEFNIEMKLKNGASVTKPPIVKIGALELRVIDDPTFNLS